MSPERQKFVERLKDVVTRLGYAERGRQTKLAERYNLAQPSVRKWFTGEAMPAYEIAVDLCRRSQTSYEWLMTGRGEKMVQGREALDPQIAAAVRVMENMTPYQVSQAVKILDTISQPMPGNGTGH
jgi:transcriptional regulator with XRE-family HTH domain